MKTVLIGLEIVVFTVLEGEPRRGIQTTFVEVAVGAHLGRSSPDTDDLQLKHYVSILLHDPIWMQRIRSVSLLRKVTSQRHRTFRHALDPILPPAACARHIGRAERDVMLFGDPFLRPDGINQDSPLPLRLRNGHRTTRRQIFIRHGEMKRGEPLGRHFPGINPGLDNQLPVFQVALRRDTFGRRHA